MREIEKEKEKASLWQVAKAVFWSFAGVRKKSDLEKEDRKSVV